MRATLNVVQTGRPGAAFRKDALSTTSLLVGQAAMPSGARWTVEATPR